MTELRLSLAHIYRVPWDALGVEVEVEAPPPVREGGPLVAELFTMLSVEGGEEELDLGRLASQMARLYGVPAGSLELSLGRGMEGWGGREVERAQHAARSLQTSDLNLVLTIHSSPYSLPELEERIMGVNDEQLSAQLHRHIHRHPQIATS
ncbi:MAG: hypothetical protein SGPRY_013004, partial [Prymnesium sp.]